MDGLQVEEVADGAADVGGVAGKGTPRSRMSGMIPSRSPPTRCTHRSGGDDASKQGMRRPVTTDAACRPIRAHGGFNLYTT